MLLQALGAGRGIGIVLNVARIKQRIDCPGVDRPQYFLVYPFHEAQIRLVLFTSGGHFASRASVAVPGLPCCANTAIFCVLAPVHWGNHGAARTSREGRINHGSSDNHGGEYQ